MSNTVGASDVIFIPVFRGTSYVEHRCSACGVGIQISQHVLGGVCFPYGKEKVKYCPGCGLPVVRFDDRVLYEKPVDFSPLEPIRKEVHTFRRRLKYIYWVTLNDAERRAIREVLPFARKLESLQDIVDAVNTAKIKPSGAHDIRKLREEFERGI